MSSTGPTYASALPGQEQLAGNYILSDVSGAVSTSASAGRFVAPYIATMYADASGEVGVLQQTTVTIVDIDRVFDISMNATEAVKILKGFVVRDEDASGSITDLSANVSVNMADTSGNFIQTLAAAIASAELKDGSGASLADWLKAEAQADVTKLLSYDTLANLLEASVLSSFKIALDASDGAADMWETISDGGAARRRILFTQLNESRVEKYALTSADGLDASNERVNVLNFLPLVKGDKFVMVFDVVLGQYTTAGSAPTVGAFIDRVSKDAGPAYASAGYIIGGNVTGNFDTAGLTIAKPTLRRVAIQLALGTDGTAGDAFDFSRTGSAANGYSISLA